MEDDRTGLQEPREDGGTELAGRQSVSFGKIRPHLGGLTTPPPTAGFDDHGNENHTFRMAEGLGSQVATLEALVVRSGRRAVLRGLLDTAGAKPTGNGEVQTGWHTTSPAGNVYIRWPTPFLIGLIGPLWTYRLIGPRMLDFCSKSLIFSLSDRESWIFFQKKCFLPYRTANLGFLHKKYDC